MRPDLNSQVSEKPGAVHIQISMDGKGRWVDNVDMDPMSGRKNAIKQLVAS
jgi:undecaprenyl pyrophosphate synthase